MPENFPALLYAFKAARRPYQLPAGPETLQVTVSPTIVVTGLPVTLTVLADDTLYDSHGWGNEAVQDIAAARYTVNDPAWLTGVISYPLTPLDGLFDAPVEAAQTVIQTAGWPPGRYHLIVDSQDAAGNWGTPGSAFLWIEGEMTLAPTTATQLADPGQMATYTFYLSNTGSLSDTFAVAVTGNFWPTSAPLTLGPVLPNSLSHPLPVTVTIPPTAQPGDFDIATITFKAETTNIELPAVALTTKAKGYVFLPLLRK